jgi:hypothetical protein
MQLDAKPLQVQNSAQTTLAEAMLQRCGMHPTFAVVRGCLSELNLLEFNHDLTTF